MNNLSTEQQEALDRIYDWYYKKNSLYFVLNGYAGTGKTFLIPYILKFLSIKEQDVIICAYTGKATFVLREKGIEQARTIHSLFYRPNIKVDIKTGRKVLFFEKVKSLPSYIKLIIIDEASMVNNEILADLLKFKRRIIFIGDSFQLPPVKKDKQINFVIDNPDFSLTKIYRHDNKILLASQQLREQGYINIENGNGFYMINSNMMTDDMLLNMQILTGKNETRKYLNNYIRKLKGLEGLPKRNEKIIVLRNNYRYGVVNGQLLHLLSDMKLHNKYKNILVGEFINENDIFDIIRLLQINRQKADFDKETFMFDSEDINQKIDLDKKKIYADFGYAITVHKSQGSEWDNVILFDDGFGKFDRYFRIRWLYTAITRASKNLIFIKK